MKIQLGKISTGIMFCMVVFVGTPVLGQQFSSDSYISKPHGMVTLILTTGQRNTMIMNTFSLFPRWEFTAAAYIYKSDKDPLTDDGYSTSLYVKYMFFENEAKTGGFAVKAGKGLDPGYIDGEQRIKEASETYWMNAPATFPFFNNKLSWDIMPGASITLNHGAEDETVEALTYTTRLAYYPLNPTWSAVGELFASITKLTSKPEYRMGLRWEPSQYANIAFTYGAKLDGSKGAGWEIGAMIFTPSFACIGGCK